MNDARRGTAGRSPETRRVDLNRLTRCHVFSKYISRPPHHLPFSRMLRTVLAFLTLSLPLFPADLTSALFDRLEFRSIGPASMGGRITDIEGVAGNPALV